MRAIVKSRPVAGQAWETGLRLEQKSEPLITRDDDVLIAVHAGAICGTDVGIYNGKESIRQEMVHAITNPVTIGHEFSGRIVDAGEAGRKLIAKIIFQKAKSIPSLQAMLAGKTPSSFAQERDFLHFLEKSFYATAEMHITCGLCYQCRKGEKHVCQNTIIKGVHDDGAWADYVKVPAENVRLFFGDQVDPDIISFMDALGNATHTVLSTKVKGSSVAVLGCGVQGLMAIAVARQSGAEKIFVTDASSEYVSHEQLEQNRFALAKQYGADACFDVALEGQRSAFIDAVHRETDGTGVDAVYEMSGSYRAYEDAFHVIRMGGEIALLGIPSGEIEVDFANEVIFHGVTIRGVIGRRVFQTWDQMEGLLADGLANTLSSTGFVSHQFPLERYDDAFTAIRRGEAYKVLLKPGLKDEQTEVAAEVEAATGQEYGRSDASQERDQNDNG